jgi:3-oxocholest-4-en-26-oyl-CoA dehydrogenase beta subunit
MDFSFTEEQTALSELAAQIFTGSSDVDRVKEIERSDDRFDRDLWRELAGADLLGLGIAEDQGGIGFGIVELCLVLEQQGRRVAPVPLLPHLLMGALPLARFGDRALAERLLPAAIAGDLVLTGAYAEPGANNVRRSSVRASSDGAGGFVLTGTKIAVPAAHVADLVLVPADTGEGLTVFLVDLGADGVSLERNETTNREIHATMHFDGVRVDAGSLVGSLGAGLDVVEWAVDRIRLGMCALALGACQEALTMAAAYTSERQQFGRPLSTNQGVAIRAADAYIDIDCMRVTLWQAAWRLSEGMTARDEIEIAKYWAAEGGQRVVHATQHLHGGMGADVDYPVHRTFLWVKQLENLFGGGSQHLARLGASIAAQAKAPVTP